MEVKRTENNLQFEGHGRYILTFTVVDKFPLFSLELPCRVPPTSMKTSIVYRLHPTILLSSATDFIAFHRMQHLHNPLPSTLVVLPQNKPSRISASTTVPRFHICNSSFMGRFLSACILGVYKLHQIASIHFFSTIDCHLRQPRLMTL